MPKPVRDAAELARRMEEDVLRLTSLLCAAKEDISPSSFNHLVRLTQNVMQCSKAVLLLSGPFDPDEGDVVRGPGTSGIDSALVRLALATDEAFVLSDVADDERFIAPSFDGLGNNLFGGAVAIHFRGVDQRHAQIEPQAQGGDLVVAVCGLFAHHPSALTENRDRFAVG